MFIKKCSALLVSAVLLSGLSASALAVEYPDVAPEHWAYSDIQKASDFGLVQGMEDGTFQPGEKLNRASFVTILQRMFGWAPAAPDAPTFPDVDASHWAYAAVETAQAHGILDAMDQFQPQAYITREEMSVMLVRALGYERLAQDLAAAGKADAFPDVTTHPGHIAVAAAIGMTNGIRDDATGVVNFQPDSFATRDQAAAMLARVYERYISKLDWLHGFYAFSSYNQIGYTAQLDGVSVGWARLAWSPDAGAWINDQKTDNNDWVKPNDYQTATSYFQGNNTPYNLNVYADTNQNVPLADDSKTSAVAGILATPDSRAQAIAVLAQAAGAYSGLTIDFEGMKEDQRANFTAFMTELRAALPGDKTLYVCVPPDDWYTGFDFRALGEVCDKVIYMVHDYQWTKTPDYYVGQPIAVDAQSSSPVTPFPRVFEALRDITDPDTGVQDKSKIALQISFGTAGFQVDENDVLQSTTIYHPAPSTISGRLAQPDTAVDYDWGYRNPVARYAGDDGATRYLLWYEDARSVGDKVDLARMFGITGVSIWRLGNIPDYADVPNYDVWSALQSQRR